MRTIRTLLLGLLLPVACRSDDRQSASSAIGGTVVVATAADAASIFPPLISDAVGADVRDQLYDRLAEIGNDLNTIGDRGFTPRLADRWDWARDSMSIAFHINPKARWHDGQSVRASDVRYSFRVVADPKVGSSVTPLVGNIDSVSVRDSLTAVVWYKKRETEQFYDFVYQVYILPEHVTKDIAPDQLRTSDVTRRGIGTGRFRMVRWNAGQRIELIADTANYRGRPKLDRLIWNIVPDAGAALAQLMSAQADVLELVPVDQAPRVDSSRVARTVPYRGLQYVFLGMNLSDAKHPGQPHPLFGDRRVRRALSMAVDRRAILQNVFGTFGQLSYGPFPRSLSVADTTLRLLPYDVNAAKALLDSAGWRESSPGAVRQKNGRTLRFGLMVPISSRTRVRYAILVQEQLRAVGAQVDIDQLQGGVAFQRQIAHDFDSAIIGVSTDPSPSGYKQQWGSEGAAKGGQNWVEYRNPVYDALVDSALSTTDVAKRKSYMKRAFQIQVDDAPAVWLYDVVLIAGLHRRLHPAPMRADGWWAHFDEWTVPPNARIDRDRLGLGSSTVAGVAR
jgi:peptide/nickel transport system substrate-binding protein